MILSNLIALSLDGCGDDFVNVDDDDDSDI